MTPHLVMRCCRDWPINWDTMPRDLCPHCGMRRALVDVRYDARVPDERSET